MDHPILVKIAGKYNEELRAETGCKLKEFFDEVMSTLTYYKHRLKFEWVQERAAADGRVEGPFIVMNATQSPHFFRVHVWAEVTSLGTLVSGRFYHQLAYAYAETVDVNLQFRQLDQQIWNRIESGQLLLD
jgi:hypothetical protein